MASIILDGEQSSLLAQSSESIEIRDSAGQLIGCLVQNPLLGDGHHNGNATEVVALQRISPVTASPVTVSHLADLSSTPPCVSCSSNEWVLRWQEWYTPSEEELAQLADTQEQS